MKVATSALCAAALASKGILPCAMPADAAEVRRHHGEGALRYLIASSGLANCAAAGSAVPGRECGRRSGSTERTVHAVSPSKRGWFGAPLVPRAPLRPPSACTQRCPRFHPACRQARTPAAARDCGYRRPTRGGSDGMNATDGARARVGSAHAAVPLGADGLRDRIGGQRQDRRQRDGLALPPRLRGVRAAGLPAAVGPGRRALVALRELSLRAGHAAAATCGASRPEEHHEVGHSPSGALSVFALLALLAPAGRHRAVRRRRDRQQRPARALRQRRDQQPGDRLAQALGPVADPAARGAA